MAEKPVKGKAWLSNALSLVEGRFGRIEVSEWVSEWMEKVSGLKGDNDLFRTEPKKKRKSNSAWQTKILIKKRNKKTIGLGVGTFFCFENRRGHNWEKANGNKRSKKKWRHSEAKHSSRGRTTGKVKMNKIYKMQRKWAEIWTGNSDSNNEK